MGPRWWVLRGQRCAAGWGGPGGKDEAGRGAVGQHRPCESASRTGGPGRCRGGPFHAQRTPWKGERVGQGGQQPGQAGRPPLRVRHSGRGVRCTASRLRVSRTGGGLGREVTGTRGHTERETLGLKRADWRCPPSSSVGAGAGLGDKETRGRLGERTGLARLSEQRPAPPAGREAAELGRREPGLQERPRPRGV